MAPTTTSADRRGRAPIGSRRTSPPHTAARETLRRALPWTAATVALRRGRTHWTSRLSRYERRRVLVLLARRGRPGGLGDAERHELRRLLDQLDVWTLIRLSVPYGAAGDAPGRLRGR